MTSLFNASCASFLNVDAFCWLVSFLALLASQATHSQAASHQTARTQVTQSANGTIAVPQDAIHAGVKNWEKRAPAESQSLWSLRPLKRPTVPALPGVKNPIDAFLQQNRQKMAGTGVRSAPIADRKTLIRRVTFDLTGLPPTPAEIDAFVQDRASNDDAFKRVVDRLLQSPHYGEQWGRHWLDIVRYADTAGENSDHPLPHAWRYRNWVIDAFNANKPYDLFLKEQLAGDLLAAQGPPEQYASRVIATGYLAIARRFGHDIDQDMPLTYEDTIDTLGKSMLGLTIGCARCHDHKFDPISARDYYGLYGIFSSTRFAFPGCEPKQQPHDLVPLLPPKELEERTRQAKSLQERIRQLEAAKAPVPTELRTELASATNIPVAYAVTEGDPKNTRLQRRGDPANLGDEVPRKFLAVLGDQQLQSPKSSGRLELAEWIASPTNPLTARVFVNRVWLWHFGRGLVKTPNDFGTRGVPPTHPELLDYLTTGFIRSGWDVKALHRLILQSAAYQAASVLPTHAFHGEMADLYVSFPRRRLSAEELRDSLLAISGELDRTPGREHPFPPEATWSFSQHAPFAAEYETLKRSVYVMQKRNRRTRFFTLFDGADPNASTPLRDSTTVPTQALFFMNDPFVHSRAEKFAARIQQSSNDPQEQIRFAYRQALGTSPTPAEIQEATTFLRNYVSNLTTVPTEHRPSLAWAAFARLLFSSNAFLYVD